MTDSLIECPECHLVIVTRVTIPNQSHYKVYAYRVCPRCGQYFGRDYQSSRNVNTTYSRMHPKKEIPH